jgi:hypothetical protein
MFVRHDSIQELPGAPQHAPFPTAPSRVACLPEYFMYCNYLKRLGTRQVMHRENDANHVPVSATMALHNA